MQAEYKCSDCVYTGTHFDVNRHRKNKTCPRIGAKVIKAGRKSKKQWVGKNEMENMPDQEYLLK